MTYIEADGEQLNEVVKDALAQVVTLGDRPTQRELELAEAVARHVSNRTEVAPPVVPCPTCHGTGLTNGTVP